MESLKIEFCSCIRKRALAVLQFLLLLMKSLNKTETSIFLSVLCSLIPKAIFFYFYLIMYSDRKAVLLIVCLRYFVNMNTIT